MNEQAIQEQYQHIVSLLEQKRLKEAQIQLEAFLWNCNDWTAETIPAAFGRNPGTCRTSAYQLTR